jgi:hypothetical protein
MRVLKTVAEDVTNDSSSHLVLRMRGGEPNFLIMCLIYVTIDVWLLTRNYRIERGTISKDYFINLA